MQINSIKSFGILFTVIFCTLLFSIASAADSDSTHSTSASAYIAGAAGATVITLTLIHYDQKIYNGLRDVRQNNRVVKAISPVITNGGDGAFSLALFTGFAGYSFFAHDQKSWQAAKIGVESFLFTGFSVQVLKYSFGRERPSHATRDGGYWHGPFAYLKHRDMSIASFDAFPSGHTTTAFSAATTIADVYNESWVSYTVYSLASCVAISRIMESTHWASDCFVGALLGHFGTKYIEYLNEGSTSISVMPIINSQRYGASITVNLP